MAIRLEVVSVGFEPAAAQPPVTLGGFTPPAPFYSFKFVVIRDGEFEGFSFSNMELFVNIPRSVGGVDAALQAARQQIAQFADKLAAEART